VDGIAVETIITWFPRQSRGKWIPLSVWRYIKQVDGMPDMNEFD
jgi:sugar phosphate permease